jgi:hypothetical protein
MSLAKVKFVTGYVPIKDHWRPAIEYGRLGEELAKIRSAPLRAYYDQLEDCWLREFLNNPRYLGTTHSVGDLPAKNSLAYHIVQHQKTEWLLRESEHDFDADTFVWVDYGICHQPGVTAAVIDDFAKRVRKDDLALPGCWDRGRKEANSPCWRFCGSLMIVPRKLVAPLNAAVKLTTKVRVMHEKRVTWEVNDWADVENNFGNIPIRWYPADHDQSQFVNYR